MPAPLAIEVTDISKHFKEKRAVQGISFDVRSGEVFGFMGHNGAGKTTTIRCITRMMPARSGTIRFAGENLGAMPSHRAARLGIGLVPEGRRCFSPLTVRENLIAAARPGPWDLDAVGRLFPRLQERQSQKAETLSGGEQQMLTIGRALMTNPRLLILDEATEGLAPVVRREIWAAIHTLKSQKLSILIVDKSVRELSTVADRCVILERGADVWTGRPAELTHDIANRYLGV